MASQEEEQEASKEASRVGRARGKRQEASEAVERRRGSKRKTRQ